MKTEAVTLTQEASAPYAREGVIFMANENNADSTSGSRSISEQIEEQQNRDQEERDREEERGGSSQRNADNPEVVRKAHEKAKALQNELKAKLESIVGGEDLPDDAQALSDLLEKNSGKFSREEIHKFLEKFSKLLDEGDLRSSPDLRKLRREFKKIEETLIKLDPQAEEITQGKVGSFNDQLLTQFGQYLGIKIKPDLEAGSKKDTTSDGVEILHVAKNIPLDQLVQLAKQLYPNQFSKESESNMVQFARDLQKAAVWMSGENFDKDLTRELYTKGIRLEEALTNAPARTIDGEKIDHEMFAAAHDQQYDPDSRGFLNVIMGRHTLGVEVSHDNVYDVLFRRWEGQEIAKLAQADLARLEEDADYNVLRAQIREYTALQEHLQKTGEQLSEEQHAERDRLLEQAANKRKEVLKPHEDKFFDKSLFERQQLFDQHLRDRTTGEQHRIAQWIKRHQFIEKAGQDGRLDRLQARTIENKLQEDILQGMVGKWQEAVDSTKGAVEMTDAITRELSEAAAAKGKELSSEEKLQIVTEFFQPQERTSAKALKYLPSEILDLFEQKSADRNLAACAIIASYQMHVMESMDLGLKVTSDLSGAHATLWVMDTNGEIFHVDPSAPFDQETQSRENNPGVKRFDPMVENGEQFVEKLRAFLNDPNLASRSTLRIKMGKDEHVIGGESLITSEFIGNLAALKVKKFDDEKIKDEDNPMIYYLKKMLPGKSLEEIQELQFALAKKAVDLAPDNYVAWAQMGKFATDGRRDEYRKYAESLNKKGVEEAEKNEFLVGAIHYEPALESVVKVDEINRMVDTFLSEMNDPTVSLDMIENWITGQFGQWRGLYEGMVTNIVSVIQSRITNTQQYTWTQNAQGHWEHSGPIGLYGIPTPEQKVQLMKLARHTFEYGVERILGKADEEPKQDYPPFIKDALNAGSSLSAIVAFSQVWDHDFGLSGNESVNNYLTVLQRVREGAHIVYLNYGDKKNFQQGVAQYLKKDGLQFFEERIAGVARAQALYEKVYASMLASNRFWPTPEDFKREADDRVDRMLKRDPNVRDDSVGGTGFRLREWQKTRTAVSGMQLSGLSQRRMVYAVQGEVPTTGVTDIVRGLEGEGNLNGLGGAVKLIVSRYFFDTNSRQFLDGITKGYYAQGPRGRQYGIIRNGKRIGLYGQDEDSAARLDSGAQDPKSMTWAMEPLFLRQKRFRTEIDPETGEETSIGLYLDKQRKLAQEAVGAKSFNANAEAEFNRRIQGVIKNQRLFLGALLHYNYSAVGEPPFNDQTRAYIWENVVKLIPSRIAAFLPDEAKAIYSSEGLNKTQWEEFQEKLWLAEDKRVQDDAIILDHELSLGEKLQKLGLPSTAALPPLRDLQYYIDHSANAFSGAEKNIVSKLQNLGRECIATDKKGNSILNANGTIQGGEAPAGLARMTFVFTAFLDDVPRTEWGNLTPDILGRLLIGNQDKFEEAGMGVAALVADPVRKPLDLVEPLEKILKALEDPLGTDDAQVKMEIYGKGYLDIAKEFLGAKFFGVIYKLFRKPRSKIEKGNLQANIAMAESETATLLTTLAQRQIISDDPNKRDAFGHTMFERLRTEYDADKLDVLLGWLRIIILLFGPMFGIELLKAMLPEDLAKVL